MPHQSRSTVRAIVVACLWNGHGLATRDLRDPMEGWHIPETIGFHTGVFLYPLV